MLTDQLLVASSKPLGCYVRSEGPTDNLITVYYHLGSGTFGRKQFFQKLSKQPG